MIIERCDGAGTRKVKHRCPPSRRYAPRDNIVEHGYTVHFEQFRPFTYVRWNRGSPNRGKGFGN